jgi:hypothetical protein
VCRFFMNKWLIAAGVLTVLLIAAVAFAHSHGAQGSDWWGSKAGWKDVGVKGWKDGAGWRRRAGCGANVTLSVAARQVIISGDGIKAAFTVDVVGVNVTKFGRVVYGTGAVELGGVSYTAKSVAGLLGRNVAELIIYTGNALIRIMYHNGRYYAVVKPLGTAGFQRFNGTAILTVS